MAEFFYLPGTQHYAEVCPSVDPDSPREWDNLGTFLTFERRYSSPDENPFGDWDSFLDHFDVEYSGNQAQDLAQLTAAAEKQGYVLLPVFKYEHGASAYRAAEHNPFPDARFDSGLTGVIYASKDDIRKQFCVDQVTPDVVQRAVDVLKGEVDDYSRWVNNEGIYEVMLYARNGDIIGGIGGYWAEEADMWDVQKAAAGCLDDMFDEDTSKMQSLGELPNIETAIFRNIRPSLDTLIGGAMLRAGHLFSRGTESLSR